MLITNVTEIRNNVGKVIKQATESKEPVVILQRSKPVAYILDKTIYEEMQIKLHKAEEIEKNEKMRKSLDTISSIREKTKEYINSMDSTDVVRKLRENDGHE